MNLTTAWDKAQNDIRSKIGDTSYDTWFSPLQVKEKPPETLLIETPDDFFKNWIIEHYCDYIQNIVNEHAQKSIRVEYSVNTNMIQQEEASPAYDIVGGNIVEKHVNKINLNACFTFDNFVIGPSNRFACAASLAVAEAPAKAYNPLFIYGQVGLGKTHLIQSITHKIQELNPQLSVCYMSSEKFTNELIDAIRHKSTTEFRKKYRNIDVLLIDDIQFIAGKESTQEEFFHTFNNLHDNRKQIIITSDRPPNEIAKLEERLRSRFAWGLITDIQPPDFETRVAILKKKMENESVNIPDEVVLFIAEQIKTNIRELEGALIRVAAYSMLEDNPVTLDMAKIILKDMVKASAKTISVEMVQKTVAEFYNLSVSDLQGKKRLKNIVTARQVAMYLSRQLTHMSLPEVGNAFGGKDHTTVLHSCKKVEAELNTNNDIKNAIYELSTKLKC